MKKFAQSVLGPSCLYCAPAPTSLSLTYSSSSFTVKTTCRPRTIHPPFRCVLESRSNCLAASLSRVFFLKLGESRQRQTQRGQAPASVTSFRLKPTPHQPPEQMPRDLLKYCELLFSSQCLTKSEGVSQTSNKSKCEIKLNNPHASKTTFFPQ